jgi:hypothetical protein
MSVEQVRRLYEAQPFQPFTLHLADGRQIPVHHREFIAFSPTGRKLFVYQPDTSFNIVNLYLVTDLEVKPNGVSEKRGQQ